MPDPTPLVVTARITILEASVLIEVERDHPKGITTIVPISELSRDEPHA
jgi:hypothetical protein